MYRREYPDVPGLFDARFSQYNRPSLSKEFYNTWPLTLIGLAMVLSSSGILFWNEGRTVRTSLALAEGRRDVIVPETIDVVFEENNGKLMLVSGPLSIPDSLTDPLYDISINAVKLRKVVQVYQWYETEDTKENNHVGDDHDNHVEKSYSYDSDWFDYYVDSSNFDHYLGHQNPPQNFWPANSSLLINTRVKIGNFLLGSDLREQFEEYKPFTSDKQPNVPGVKIHAGLYYHSRKVWQPEVGDWRIQYSYAGRQGDEFTAVAKQSGRELRPYTTEGGEELAFLHKGVKGSDEIFLSEQTSNRISTWIYRLVGWLVSFLGLSCLYTILETVLELYPRFRRVLVPGLTSVNFSFSVSLTLIVIGVGWVLYRPLVGLALLALAVAPYILPASRLDERGRLFG